MTEKKFVDVLRENLEDILRRHSKQTITLSFDGGQFMSGEVVELGTDWVKLADRYGQTTVKLDDRTIGFRLPVGP